MAVAVIETMANSMFKTVFSSKMMEVCLPFVVCVTVSISVMGFNEMSSVWSKFVMGHGHIVVWLSIKAMLCMMPIVSESMSVNVM